MGYFKKAGKGTSKIFTAVLVMVFILAASVFTSSGHLVSAQEYEPEAGDYQSIGSGNWDNPGNWEVYNGTGWVEASDYPGHEPGDYSVTIHSGHEVNDNNINVLEFGDLIIYGRLSLTYKDYDLTLNSTSHLIVDGGAIYWYANVALNLPADAALEVRNIKDESGELIVGLGLYAPNNPNNNMRIRIGDIDYAAAMGEGNVVCTFDMVNESGGSLVAVAIADPAGFEYNGSLSATKLTGNVTGFGSDPAEATLSFSWTGTGPNSFVFSSSVQDPGEIALDAGGITRAGEYLFAFTVTSEIIATGAVYSHSDDVLVTVNPALGELIVTGITCEDKEYDGNIDAVIDFSGAELVGVVSGNDVSLDYSGATATFGDEDAGSSKAVTVTGLILTGSDAGSYTLIPPTVTADITSKALNVTGITGEDKEYDGTVDATIGINGPVLEGIISGDDVSLDYSGAAATFVDKNVGTSKTITVTGLILTGADARNYTPTPPVLTADITFKELTITANDSNKNFGDPMSFTGIEFAALGLLSGDSVSSVILTCSGTAEDAAAGTYTIIPSEATGTGMENYAISYVNGILTVSPKALSITANSTSKNYGDTVTFAGSEFTIDGLVNGDTVTIVTLTSGGTTEDAAAGTYTIIPSEAMGTGLENYAISYVNGILTVSPKALSITANSTSKNYGDTVTFAGSEFTIDGLVNGDTVTIVTLTSVGTTEDAAAGTYTIIPSEAMGTGLGNYVISYVDGMLTVNTVNNGGGGGLAWWVILLIVLAVLCVTGTAVWYFIRRRRFV